MAQPTLEVRNLVKHFPVRGKRGARAAVRAVDGVDLRIEPGEILGLVGESGSGKTTVGKCVTRLLSPTAGEIWLNGRDITELSRRRLRPLRRDMHMVFQDPYSSLNPRMRAGEIVRESLTLHGFKKDSETDDRVRDIFRKCGLGEEMHSRFPHQLSGGQRQRVGLARALVLEPSLVVADEPVSALDVSVRASILNLVLQLQEDMGFSCLFISHDLATVEFVSDRIAVMYLGQIFEVAPSAAFMARPKTPYSQALLSALLVPDPVEQARRDRILLTGDIPSPARPPPGCRFHTRCPLTEAICRTEVPQLLDTDGRGHLGRCHLIGQGGEAPDASAASSGQAQPQR